MLNLALPYIEHVPSFKNSLGLMQSEILSALVFSILHNDFEISFISNGAVLTTVFLVVY